MSMRKHNVFRFDGSDGTSQRKRTCCSKSAKDLYNDEAGCIGRSNPGKCICECSRESYRRIGKGSGSRKPVGAGDVKTDR